MEGWIRLHRDILDSDVFASQKMLKIWIWCLCKANFKDRKVPLKIGRGETLVKVKRGQFIFGRFKAEEELFIDGSTIYKIMLRLEKMNNIKIQSNNQYSIVTINKYNDYQRNDINEVATKEQPSSKQVTTNAQPSNTTKNDKKEKNVNNDNNNTCDKSLHALCKEIFLTRCFRLNSSEYYWTAKDGKHLNQFIKKIEFKTKEAGHEITDESITKGFTIFINSISDKWVLNNFSISNINSKFNEIYGQIKQGGGQPKSVAQQIRDLDYS